MPAAPHFVSSLLSIMTVLAAFGLFLPLLLLLERKLAVSPVAGHGRPMRLRLIRADGTEHCFDVARNLDELQDAFLRQQLAPEQDVTLRLHPLARGMHGLRSMG
jgi:hypothetical protein